MLTYLHHSDPTIVHYRNKEWSFLRGATSTVDRPLLGWAGRFFLHNVSHDHVRTSFFFALVGLTIDVPLALDCAPFIFFYPLLLVMFYEFIVYKLIFRSRQPTQGY